MKKTKAYTLEKLKYRLNLLFIALLCSTTLAPCAIFYVRGAGEWKWLIAFTGVGFLVAQLPNTFYDKFQLSTNLKFYKRLRVDVFKKFSSNGDLINKRIRKKFPGYRNVNNLKTIQEKLRETYLIEKSHTVLFVFCLLTSIYAYRMRAVEITVLLFIGNILFNYYPTLLQQYNRIRYKRVVEQYSRKS